MRKLYEEKTANYPRLDTDTFFVDYDNSCSFHGFVDHYIRFIEEFQLMNEDCWKRFVKQYKDHTDTDELWRGEFWGKMMRGACFTYSYSKSSALYKVLTNTVLDMLDAQDEDGRISTYPRDWEFHAWDIWCRKYVLLGMEYYLEICQDEALKQRIIEALKGHLDYIISKVGDGEGQISITKAAKNWRGVNSSSILEPVVRLYVLTEEKRYFDFASYIVENGFSDVENMWQLAYEDKMYPYQYPVTKAYEMMSCFEGLLEFYRITKIEKYKTSVVNFANKILESDFTIIGSCGCTHELFDHSTVRQANTTNEYIAQETCVTVTLIKFFYQVMLITGDGRYADAMETSLYNAFFGSVNTDKVIDEFIIREHPECIKEPLPFDSYSPLTAGTRGRRIGGLNVMPDLHYYGCCACIGSAASGLISKVACCTTRDGFALNLFIDGKIMTKTPEGQVLCLETETAYPRDGHVKVTLRLEKPESFVLLVRDPKWSKDTAVSVNQEVQEAKAQENGYVKLERTWKDADVLEIDLDMRTEAIRPIPYGNQIIMNKVIWTVDQTIGSYDEEDPMAKYHMALRRGPLVLAQDCRLGYSVDEPVDIAVGEDGYVDVKLTENPVAPYENILEVEVPLTDGSVMHVTDYASAGKLWTEESKMAAWMLTKTAAEH